MDPPLFPLVGLRLARQLDEPDDSTTIIPKILCLHEEEIQPQFSVRSCDADLIEAVRNLNSFLLTLQRKVDFG